MTREQIMKIISNNNLSLNNFNGIFLHTNCNENIIRGNTIFNNVWEGIEIFVSQNNIVTDNEIISNGGTGIMISMSTSINNLIYHNNFIDTLQSIMLFLLNLANLKY